MDYTVVLEEVLESKVAGSRLGCTGSGAVTKNTVLLLKLGYRERDEASTRLHHRADGDDGLLCLALLELGR